VFSKISRGFILPNPVKEGRGGKRKRGRMGRGRERNGGKRKGGGDIIRRAVRG
jgi:hypothetical protein